MIGQGKLREFARARSDEVDEQQRQPASGRLPQRGKAILIGVCRPAKERSAADPRAEQRQHQHDGRQ
jgi:hypothetical protein